MKRLSQMVKSEVAKALREAEEKRELDSARERGFLVCSTTTTEVRATDHDSATVELTLWTNNYGDWSEDFLGYVDRSYLAPSVSAHASFRVSRGRKREQDP